MRPLVAIHERHAHARRWQMAFALGLARHGLAADWTARGDDGRGYDLSVVWSVKDPAYPARRAAGRPVLVMEAGYLGDRLEWCALGYDGLNGRADFLNAGMPGDRWEKHFADLMRPWRDGGETIVVMGQVRGDAALRGIDPIAWARSALDIAAQRWPLAPIVFRPHPRDPDALPPNAELVAGSLAEALDEAGLVITFNSTSGVDAALAGVPVVALDEGSMAWPVAAHGLRQAYKMPGRTQWARDLAYCQWNEAEIAAGDAWDHLKRKFA